jgi:hypothetical protein
MSSMIKQFGIKNEEKYYIYSFLTFGLQILEMTPQVSYSDANKKSVAGSLNKRLMLSSSFRCDQI